MKRALFIWVWTLLMVFGVFLGGLMSADAEIYKWQDDAGITYYSNHPPNMSVQSLETIPTHNLSSEQRGPLSLYYSTMPEVSSNESFTVPPEVLQELSRKDVVNVAVSQPSSPEFSDMTILTMRLTELEDALQREIQVRLSWEYQYTRAQSVINSLQQHNGQLNAALHRVEKDLDQLRGTVVASDIQVAALKQWGPFQQLAMLEEQVSGITGHLNSISTEVDKLKTVSVQPVQQAVPADSETRSLLTNVMAKNQLLEAVIKRQAGVLEIQNQQIALIESQLAQLQGVAPDHEPPRSGIRIVLREKPRKASFWGYAVKRFEND